ncbi:MAG: LptF/LptG family permease [candidate division WOR-3 bacterium]
MIFPILDRFLYKEIVKFTFLALASVVTIYILIDVFEEIDYFLNYHTGLPLIFLYYLHILPEAINLLLPASLILATFMVYGRMTRSGELVALRSSGITLFRIFQPAILIGFISIFFLFWSKDFLEIPLKRKLRQFQREKIEKKEIFREERRRDIYYIGEDNYIFYIKELERKGRMGRFTISHLDEKQKVRERYDGDGAIWNGKIWLGKEVFIRRFSQEGESLERRDTLSLLFIKEKPEDFFREIESSEEMRLKELIVYINKMRKIGYATDQEEVNYHLRFSQAFIGLIVILLGLPLAVRLRRGGVTLGLGLGLLFSFLFWGMIQIFRAMGEARLLSPFLSTFLPDFIFLLLALFLMLRTER